MKKKVKRGKGFTLTEIIVGAIILMAVFGNLLAGFVALGKYSARANRRLIAANLARSFFDNLTSAIREDRWSEIGNWLYPGNYSGVINVTIDGVKYIGNLSVENVTDRDYRKVILNITFFCPGIEG